MWSKTCDTISQSYSRQNFGCIQQRQTFINEKNPKAFATCGGAFQTNLQKFFVSWTTELASSGVLILTFVGR